MAASLEDSILDGGLTLLDTTAVNIYICAAEPTTFTLATTSNSGVNMLGAKTFSTGGVFNAPTSASINASVNGRKVVSNAVSDGSIINTGTAAWWAVTTGAALLAHGSLSASQAVTAGNTFTLAAFEIKMPAS